MSLFTFPKVKKSLLLFFLLLILSVRFIHLEADFPEQINTSGDLYTDEGWYTSNAVHYIQTKDWYIAGELNPAVNFPILTYIQIPVFKLFGINLISARSITAAFSLLLCFSLYFFLKKYVNETTAWIATLMIGINFYYFAYSRLALLEIPMLFFCFVNFILAWRHTDNNVKGIGYTVLTGLISVLAILTKTSAIFMIPTIILIFLIHEIGVRQKLKKMVIYISSVVVLLALYYVCWVNLYQEDFSYFSKLNFNSKVDSNLIVNIKDIIRAFINISFLDKVLGPITLLTGLFVYVKETDRTRKQLLLSSYIWIVLYTTMLGMGHYLPPRYYVVLTIPFAIILAICLNYIFTANWNRKISFSVVTIVLGVYAFINLFSTFNYTTNPEFSFYSMSSEIRSYVEQNDNKNPVILAYANTINLTQEDTVIASQLGTWELREKLEHYKPQYYLGMPIGVKDDNEVKSEIQEKFDMIEVDQFNVFNNYYTGRPLALYELINKDEN